MIEVLVVMVITGIVSAISVISLSSLGDTRDAAAARRLLHDLSYAREMALSTGLRTWVKFDTTDQTYAFFSETAATPGRASAKDLLDPATGRAYMQSLNTGEFGGVRLTSASFDGDVYLGFDWMGAPLGVSETALTATGSVVFSGGHGVTVEPQSGSLSLVSP